MGFCGQWIVSGRRAAERAVAVSRMSAIEEPATPPADSGGRVRSRQDSLAFQSRLQRSPDLTPIDVIEHCARRAAECVATDLERKGNLASAYELVGRSVCRNLDDLSLESVGIGQPGPHE